MIRALFVDDEPAVLEGLENRLRRLRSRWKISFADRAETALEKLTVQPFDVVVSDLRMPGMDGASLLELVRAMHPGAIRIALTGGSGAELLLATLSSAHQVLSKPCDAQLLDAVVVRVRALHGWLGDEALRQRLAGLSRLAPLPALREQLARTLEAPDAKLGEVAAIVECDAAWTARLLQLANSAFSGVGRSVTSGRDAAKYLGLNILREIAASTELFESIDPNRVGPAFSLEHVHAHSLRCARIASRLLSDESERKSAFTAAVLHDLGRVLLAVSAPGYLAAALERAQNESVPLHVAEYAVHGFSHAEVGAYLLALWGVPAPIVEAVAHHHCPSRSQESTFGPIGALHVADCLCQEAQLSAAGTPCAELPAAALDSAYLERAAVRDRVDAWREMVARDFSSQSV